MVVGKKGMEMSVERGSSDVVSGYEKRFNEDQNQNPDCQDNDDCKQVGL